MEKTTTEEMAGNKSVVMLVYGRGGRGKTFFAASAKNSVIFDFERGTKYLKDAGIDRDVYHMSSYFSEEDKQKLPDIIKEYDTIVIDPIGECMNKLIEDKQSIFGGKYRQANGDLTIAGWGKAKSMLRQFITYLRDSGKNVIIVAHAEMEKDDESIFYRPLIPTKITEEVMNLVDIVAYLENVREDGGIKRHLICAPGSLKYESKDRTGRFVDNTYIEPDFDKIVEICNKPKEQPTQRVELDHELKA